MISIQIGFYANTSQRPILNEIGLILNNKIREWINIRSTISRYLPAVEHQLTWKKENNSCSLKCCHNHSLAPPEKRPGKLCLFQFRLLSGNIFHSFYSRLTPSKTSLSECWCRYKKKKFVFTIRFHMKKDKKEETMNLILIEEAWICITGNFSAFFGQTEASAKRPQRELCDKWQTQLKINLILITYQF